MHQWFYIASGTISDETAGPISEAEIIALFQGGKLTIKTPVSSPTRTAGKWLTAIQIPGLVDAAKRGEAERKSAADANAAAKAAAKLASQLESEERRNRDAAEAERAVGFLRNLCSQNPYRVKSIYDEVSRLLTAAEKVEYVAVQEWPILTFFPLRPDAIVLTNRRVIFFRPRLLGRYDFSDHLWLNLSDAHIAKHLLGAEFTATSTAAGKVGIRWLPREPAERVYRVAQEREEAMLELRRRRAMEETRAGATNIAVTAAATPVVQDVGTRLATIQDLLSRGLITASDYESRKSQILASI